MTDTQLKYFNKLRVIHLRLSESLKDPRINGVNSVISNLYRDDAHFVYELLQNADDQGATYAKFILKKDEVIFVHNAPRHFTITDPDTHEEDKKNGRLGNINSILSIASSSKSDRTDEIPIGKFGLGFKSVFLYTDSPCIYDKNLRFSITDFIVPNLIDCDHPMRQREETLFAFKFKNGAQTKAYQEIDAKLKSLVNPLLFLNNLKLINWENESECGYYRLDKIGQFGTAERLKYTVANEDERSESELWKFSRQTLENPKLQISAVFVIEDGVISSKTHPLYCYLPTANQTELPVILHAPFKLTGNRESITHSDHHNIKMLSELANLLSESLIEICERGQTSHSPWIKDNIIDFLPAISDKSTNSISSSIDLSPIRDAVLESIHNGRLLWCEQFGEYLSPHDSCVAENSYLAEIYPSEILEGILGKRRGWVLPSLIGDLKRQNGVKLIKELGVERITPDKLLRQITSDFLAQRPIDWLCQWYCYLPKIKNLWETTNLRSQEIILTSSGVFKSPFTKGKLTPNVYLSCDKIAECEHKDIFFVNPKIANNETLTDFFSLLGIKGIDDFSIAERIYLPKIVSDSTPIDERIKTLVLFIKLVENQLTSEQRLSISSQCMVPARSENGIVFVNVLKVKVHNPDNDFYYRENKSQLFFEPSDLTTYLKDEDINLIAGYIRSFQQTMLPTIRFVNIPIDNTSLTRIPNGVQRPAWYNKGKIDYEYIKEPIIEEFEHFISKVAPLHPYEASSLLEKLLISKFHKATYCSFYGGWQPEIEIWPNYRKDLVDSNWIEFASSRLRQILGLPLKEIQPQELDSISRILSDSGIISKDDVNTFLQYIQERGILDDFELKKEIEEQKRILSNIGPGSLSWLNEILNLRLKYVESGQKTDIEFLIRALQDVLSEIKVDENIDLRSLLPNNINVIFGPPGTGKTTKITHIISDILDKNPFSHIVILAPTNHAADVVAERLLKNQIEAYRSINTNDVNLLSVVEEKGLMVYEAMGDENIPQIVVSTTHYFARPTHLCNGHSLHEEKWDAIFIDETSMVTLDYVLLALFKGYQNNSQCTFYLVGDPFQLPAITNLDPDILEQAQLDEFNFYSFIGLNEFTETPENIPDYISQKLNIQLLRTQFRSVRPLCELMSAFAYGGKVQSDFRSDSLEYPVNIPSIFRSPLTFVRFPVSKQNAILPKGSITDLGKLRGSNYNIYSALLIKESLQAFFNALRDSNFTDKLSVGIITPYKAQKKLIEKLLNANAISRDARIEVNVNTVHQFQGDEFDIVMLVLNPPNQSMTPTQNILINKHYLINVAISRAKRNLIILYPDNSCKVENYQYINKNSSVENIESIAEQIFNCNIEDITIFSPSLENELFGNYNYLINQCEVTFHDEVNLHESTSIVKYRFVTGGETIDIII